MSTGPSAPPASQPAAASDVTCPLCGVPLEIRQDWCLRCGAAARTRLAASAGWRAPLISLAVVIVLSLVVLAGALVKLAGDSNGSGSTSSPSTVTATVPATPPAGTVTESATAGPSGAIPSTPVTAAPATGASSGATGTPGALATAGSGVPPPSASSANPSTAKAKP
jgi:hypothetical protein